MQFEGALITEQQVTFGIVGVKSFVLADASARRDMEAFGHAVWGPVPIVLMAADGQGVPTYYGRPDIVRFLANVEPWRIPWQRYTVGAA